jgi:chorismate-pyruvate lyase
MSYSPSMIDAAQRGSTETNFYHPLDDFYANARLKMPEIELVNGATVPSPFRELLVHDGDMTPTLEKFHEAKIHLKVLRREQPKNYYLREVVLLTEKNNAVEFGAIKIFLDLFPLAARNYILAERLPLGSILAKFKIEHTSRPKAFLKIQSDEFINRALLLSGKHVLYGRRNTLSNMEGKPIAEIVEILPPAEKRKETTNGHE